jgi:pyruvate/2-oxoglutarate/acetoin dehydrogenase E1 component
MEVQENDIKSMAGFLEHTAGALQIFGNRQIDSMASEVSSEGSSAGQVVLDEENLNGSAHGVVAMLGTCPVCHLLGTGFVTGI